MSSLNDYLYNLVNKHAIDGDCRVFIHGESLGTSGKCRISSSKHHNYNVHMRVNDCSIDVVQKGEDYVRTVNCPYSNFKQVAPHNWNGNWVMVLPKRYYVIICRVKKPNKRNFLYKAITN
jgi:hypothetical protein